MNGKKVRLTMGQAVVEYLQAQYSERDGEQRRLIPAMFGIFGHGNATGLGQALMERGKDLPFYQPGAYPVLSVTDAEFAAIEAVFQKMEQEIASDYTYKHDLLRAYLLEMIHYVQKLRPAPVRAPAQNASARLTAQFADLLERQFPLESPQQRLRLRTATDYAAQLSVHVNHLNRVLKETTGHTTTALIGSRVGQEAKILLKQTNWNIAEIADSLGFADGAHFCNSFKRQTGLTPGNFRG